MIRSKTHRLTISAMLLALGMLMPLLVLRIPTLGQMLSPMHIPVFLCGLICGGPYGLAVGFLLPFLNHLVSHMPPSLFPKAVGMAFEMGAYGLSAGLLYRLVGRRDLIGVYAALIGSMLIGRAVYGLTYWVFMKFFAVDFSWKIFVSTAFIKAVPAIIAHLVLVPLIMLALGKAGLIPFDRR